MMPTTGWRRPDEVGMHAAQGARLQCTSQNGVDPALLGVELLEGANQAGY
jgi:hypothetical protein